MNARQSFTLQMHPGVYPYLITRIVPAMYHIILLPKGQQTELVEIARTQMSFNKLESCLVLSANEGVYLYPDGSEARSSHVPFGGILMYNQLKPCRIFSEDQELRERKEFLEKHIESLKQGGYVLGDTTKGGKKPTPQEADNLRGNQENGVPKGLVPCPRCGEWRGTCLDLIPDFGESIVRVNCLCQNDNRCANCGDLLYERKLNANYYDPKDGRIWHVAGFCGFGHICKLPALNQK
jgi:hypothetical protein